MIRTTSCTALLLLASCAGPAVETARVSSVVPPPAWRTNAGPVAPLYRDWWQAFGDPALTALVEKALANNPDIAIAAGRVREAQANIALARSRLLPALDAGIGGGKGNDNDFCGNHNILRDPFV